MRIVYWMMAAVLMHQLAASPRAMPAAQPAGPTLDYEFFKTQVQPVFLAKRTGYTRCVVCHADEGAAAFLQPLPAGATVWNEEQSRKNFQSVSRLVVPGQPMKSRLLTHPLEPAAGGDEFHNGGRQFKSQDDPEFKVMAAWVSGRTAGSQR